jgi:hypothetical protein
MGAAMPLLRRPDWRIFLLLLVCYVYFLPRYADWSQASRTALIVAIVNEGQLAIDAYGWSTGDYAEFQGHRYSDKAPGPALLGVPAYAVTRTLLASPGGQRLIDRLAQGEALRSTLKSDVAPRDKIEFALAQLVATWAVVSIPAAMLGVGFYGLLRQLTGSEPNALLMTLGYALGTSAFPYAGALYSHQLCAALLFGSVILLWKVRAPDSGRLLAVGLLLGLALASEYPTALIVGGIGLYALATTRRLMTGVMLGIGMIPPLAAMAVYNVLIFGTPLPVGYEYSALWQTEHQTGFFSLSVPTFEAFWGITFGAYRGLFLISPILLLGPVGIVLLARRPGYRFEAALCGWCVASFLFFNSSSFMWSGGFGIGPRYLVPMLPFLALGVGIAVRQWSGVAAFRGLVACLMVWSLGVTWALTIGGQTFPTYDPYPLWDLAVPALAQGDIARNLGTLTGLHGWWSLLPLLAAMAALVPWRRFVSQSGVTSHAVSSDAVTAGPLRPPLSAMHVLRVEQTDLMLTYRSFVNGTRASKAGPPD